VTSTSACTYIWTKPTVPVEVAWLTMLQKHYNKSITPCPLFDKIRHKFVPRCSMAPKSISLYHQTTLPASPLHKSHTSSKASVPSFTTKKAQDNTMLITIVSIVADKAMYSSTTGAVSQLRQHLHRRRSTIHGQPHDSHHSQRCALSLQFIIPHLSRWKTRPHQQATSMHSSSNQQSHPKCLKHVMSFTANVDLAALFYIAQDASSLCVTLEELGHLKPTNNALLESPLTLENSDD
jgi:hypothetical protein